MNVKRFCLWLALVLVLAAAGAAWALTHHVVRTRHGTAVLEKRFLTFTETWVDAREWTLEDFEAHPAVRRALLQAGYAELIAELRREQVDESVKRLAAETDEAIEAFKDFITDKVDEWLGEAESVTNAPAPAGDPQPDAGG